MKYAVSRLLGQQLSPWRNRLVTAVLTRRAWGRTALALRSPSGVPGCSMRRAGIKSGVCWHSDPAWVYNAINHSPAPPATAAPLDWPVRRWQAWLSPPRAAHHSCSLPYPHCVSPPRCKWQKTLGWRRECVRFNGACQPRGPLCLGLCVNYKELKRDENQGAVSVTRGRTLVYVSWHFICWTTQRKSLCSFFLSYQWFLNHQSGNLSPSPGRISIYTNSC